MGFHVVKGVTRGTGSDVFQIVVENEVVIAGSPPRNVSLENVDFMGGLVLTVELFEFEVRMYGVEVRVCASGYSGASLLWTPLGQENVS